MNHLMNTYKTLPLQIVRGHGCYLWDSEDKKYLDTISGVAVCNLGHCHPAITAAIQQQAQTLVHSSNLVKHPSQEKLADKLSALSGMSNVFFGNSGAEANEAAIKLARMYGHRKGIAHPKIITMQGSFHGRTLATLSASGNPKIQAGFTPLVEGFIHVPFNDVYAVRQQLEQHKDIVAIMAEPIQGEGGMHVPNPFYLAALRQLSDEFDCLLILDEIQSGMGRTGKWFAHQHTEIKPDIMTLAKALANGIPIGACLAGPKAQDLFQPGSHGSTFGGNPLATCVGLEVIKVIEKDNLLHHVNQQSERLFSQLRTQLTTLPAVKDIRGQGLWIGIELDRPAPQLLTTAAERGFILNIVQDNVIRLAPPLIIEATEIDCITHFLAELIAPL